MRIRIQHIKYIKLCCVDTQDYLLGISGCAKLVGAMKKYLRRECPICMAEIEKIIKEG